MNIKKIAGLTGLIGICLVSSSLLFAANTIDQISGKIEQLFVSENSFSVGSVSRETGIIKMVQLKVDADTQFTNAISLSELRLGDQVFVEYSQATGGIFIAERVRVDQKAPPQDIKKKKNEKEGGWS